ncbi:cation/H(+) antiporter 4-like [Trifolium pratense]|uniref:cation/H(+) antiporter 4-like n=1 Tax=Trifolium pratense TaxID=57577 RepID=UPI001E6945DF|nr:cation/H(+) antiporter 4-like [Trifolium pratense]
MSSEHNDTIAQLRTCVYLPPRVGLIFAATFNKTWTGKMKMLFYFDSQENLGLISMFGYMLFLFYIGVKTEMSVVHKTRSGVTNIGVIGIIAPYLCGMAVLNSYSSKYLTDLQVRLLGAIIGLFSMAPFPVISSTLSDLKILNSELGRIGLSASLVSELFNVFLASMITISKLREERGEVNAMLCALAAILYILLVIFIIRPAMFWIIKQTPEGSHVSDNYVYSILTLTLFTGYASYRFGFFALFGPFILGLAIPEGPPLGTAIVKKIDTFVNEIFFPIFVTTCCMRVDLKDLLIWRNQSDGSVDYFMVQTLVIVQVIVVTKFVACMIIPLRNGMPWNDAICLSLIMSSKGFVEMVAFSLVRDSKGLPGNIFALLMICIIVNSTLIPMMLGYMYDPTKKYAGYIKRNIADLKSNSEFRVLACIHRPNNIPATINLLEATYPTKEEPICTYALQLVELIGRASPIFISHNLQKKNKSNSDTSMADKLLESFRSFEREFQDCLVVNAFTAISPPEMMYDDICTLALDNFTSLIILPFHRQWSCDGNSVELEDESLRDINYRVLERAPCSVGVLIERAQMTHIFSPETPYKVCLIFIGGKDDREALFFTKRMTKNPHVKLTVVRFLSCDDDVDDDSKGSGWENKLDNELLDEIKTKNKIGNVSVKYVERTVKDGPETALIIRSLATEFDLIVVGRQAGVETPQTSGLLQWSEYSELGVLGDLLVSTDAGGKASVFVIQQQRTTMDV